jgi:hypothetical protein
MYVHLTKSRRRPGLSLAGLRLLRRLEQWREHAAAWPTPSEFASDGTRDWMTLQGLLGRGLVNLNDRGLLRLTAEGWRYLRAHRHD